MKNESKQEKQKQVGQIKNSQKTEIKLEKESKAKVNEKANVKENKKLNEGITLIALVITIVVLIILAGVSINLVLGENGLFSKAREATEMFSEAQKEEEEVLAELEMEIRDNENLPEITNETPAGTQVKLPNEWITTDENKEEKISVRAVAVGEGDKVPVPKGFYYVGGTIESGVVISDDPKDQNKYASYEPEEGEEGIPSGVVYNSDGTVNVEKSELKGNQFVWIPVEAKDYEKVAWKNENEEEYKNAEWDTETPEEELEQIKKYGGFYIGRYEAGTSNITLTANSTKVDFTAAHTVESWIDDKFSIRDELLSNRTISGKITCKAGEIPYYHADYYTASKLCDNMYQTDYVKSALVTGTMWDVMMNFIAGDKKTVVTTDCKWGNYNEDTGLKYTEGQGRYATVSKESGTIGSNEAFAVSKGKYNYGIWTTASTEGVKKKNLYDVAGNLWEWTQEAAYNNDDEKRYIIRGGSFRDSLFVFPACYRSNYTAIFTGTNYGFRPALYIK